MKIGLFIPCYVNQFYPKVAIATYELLQKLGCTVEFPLDQTCCGQPMANSGYEHLTKGCDKNFIDNFSPYDYIVCPSGSCVLHVKEHLHDEKREELAFKMRKSVFELTEFITDVLKITEIEGSFPHTVGMHQSCHGQRGLKLSQMSELNAPFFSKPNQLLSKIRGLELVSLSRKDECCGFGGTFCVTEEAVSVKMGQDRIKDHKKQGVEYITGGDMSCLMHLEGILKRQESDIKIIHIAEILNSSYEK
ncbi:(Fe-S)-binding protein [Flavobacterium granuli]|uniref:L-lactate dehydrogenase complex protein LldE n=1 Tax=Flavobacterium granuli TaxID=280093 RepID=A0ABU1S583_9FLAO|nr:(Fe-S)-binding protein [Flavobacterium granuli]MDR6846216.1 L-lactate dehydrogenase complex protein LldE [Flavobacterium granuli]